MKTLMFIVLLLMIANSVFAFPTYTTNTHTYFTGNYGNSSYPCNVQDETGSQLFDGDYGGYDWFANPGGVQSDEDYLARYAEQNGYGYGWVAWYNDIPNPTIIFDMGQPFTFQQIGVHGYKYVGISVPSWISIAFSDDGIDFAGNLGFDVSGIVTDDSVVWKIASFTPTQARYIRIDFPTAPSYWFDEVSINGMDGATFIPEPASFAALCGGVIILGILKRKGVSSMPYRPYDDEIIDRKNAEQAADKITKLERQKSTIRTQGGHTGRVNRQINQLRDTSSLQATRRERLRKGLPTGQIDDELRSREAL